MDVRRLDLGPARYDWAFVGLHALAELASEGDLLQALRRVATCLTDGGVFSCSLHNPVVRARGAQAEPWGRHWAPSGRRRPGLGNFDRFFLGSVSAQVTLHAPCSVLVVKQPPRPVRQILLAVDGSKASDRALHFLLHDVKPAKKGGIEVTVLYVLPPFAYSEVAVAGINLAHRYADKLAAAGYRVHEAYMPGDPADEIVAAAKSRRVDLVVAGAKGLSAVGRFLLGSVSTKLVRHCPCSILVVR